MTERQCDSRSTLPPKSYRCELKSGHMSLHCNTEARLLWDGPEGTYMKVPHDDIEGALAPIIPGRNQRGVILGDAIFGKTPAEFARAVAENQQMRQMLDAFEAWLDERWNNDVLTIAVRLTFGSALIELRQRRAQPETT